MVWWDDEEEWWKIRCGHVSEEEERLFRRLVSSPAPRRPTGGSARSKVIMWRNWTRENNWGRTNGKQAVVKVVGMSYSPIAGQFSG